LFKYPSELSAKPHWGEASGHLDPRIVQTNPKTKVGDTPLHIVAAYRWFHRDRMELLLAHHAQINPKNDLGWTPLRVAEHHNNNDAAKWLREYGGWGGRTD